MKGFHYVYILVSEQDEKRHYTGLTENLIDRLKAHNAGQVPHTSKFREGTRGHPICILSSKKVKFFYYNNIIYLKPKAFFRRTASVFLTVIYSAVLSLNMSSILNRYVYSAYRVSPITDHPLSKLWSSARGP